MYFLPIKFQAISALDSFLWNHYHSSSDWTRQLSSLLIHPDTTESAEQLPETIVESKFPVQELQTEGKPFYHIEIPPVSQWFLEYHHHFLRSNFYGLNVLFEFTYDYPPWSKEH